jgi:hypothetical protein
VSETIDQTASELVAGRRRAQQKADWSTKPIKVTMNLPEGCVKSIQWLAERLQIPNSHVVRRAIDLRRRIQEELDAGATVLIERDGQVTQIWFE